MLEKSSIPAKVIEFLPPLHTLFRKMNK